MVFLRCAAKVCTTWPKEVGLHLYLKVKTYPICALPRGQNFHRTDKCVSVLSKFNGTSTPKGSYRAKTGDNDCNVNSSRYSLSTALRESIRYQTKSEQNVRQDLIPRVRHGEAALCTPAPTSNDRLFYRLHMPQGRKFSFYHQGE